MNNLSRQRRWQLDKQRAGLCTLCGHGRLTHYAARCDRCTIEQRVERRKRLGTRTMHACIVNDNGRPGGRKPPTT
jgi:uncharacterized paraquat-inducible protein A